MQNEELPKPETLIEKPKANKAEKIEEKNVKMIPPAKKSFPRKYIYWSIAAALLFGSIFLGVKTGVLTFEISDKRPIFKAENDLPTVNNQLEKTLVISPFATDADAENEESFGDGLADSLNKKLGQIQANFRPHGKRCD